MQHKKQGKPLLAFLVNMVLSVVRGEYAMNQVMISIVVPVYNVEKYINQCIDSILGQTYPHFELICVDDGSTDKSYKILKGYEKQDSRVIVIQQKNQYAGVARNRGMEIARGKYILFLDSDDFVEENMLELLMDQAEKDKTDILVFDSYQYDNATQKVINTLWTAVKPNLFGSGIKSAEGISDIVFDFTTPVPWNKFYLREFIIQNDIKFQDLKRTNDLFFVYASLACANRIGVLNQKLYYYRDNNKESLQGSGDETPEIFAKALYALKEWLESRNYWNTFQNSFVTMATSLCLYNWNNMKSRQAYYKLAESLKNEILPRLCLGIGNVDEELKRCISNKQEIMVYGAGTIAKTMVQYLLFQCEYDKERISVVVSKMGNNKELLCDIEVQCFDNLTEHKKDVLVIIAVADANAQKAIQRTVCAKGFKKCVMVGFEEIASLVRNGIY